MSLLLLLLVAQAAPYVAAALPDPTLADQRGGFRLPNGVDVALTVQTQTAVNGAVVLTTVFRADHGAPTLTTYVPRAGTTVTAAGGETAGGGGGTTTSPQISFDGRGGITVTPGFATMGVSTASKAADAVADGLEAVTGPTATDHGLVTQGATTAAVRTATLDAGDLSVTHLAGNAFGAAIANTGSDRTIDTNTSVAIDLHGAGPDVVGSTMMRVEDVALGAIAARNP